MDLALVRINLQMLGGKKQFYRYFFLGTGAFKGGGCIFYYLMDVEFLPVQQHIFIIELIQCQKILGQVCQSFRFKQNDLQILFMHFRRDRSIRHSFHVSFDRCQRRPEVMGDVCDKFFLIVFDVTELRRHII